MASQAPKFLTIDTSAAKGAQICATDLQLCVRAESPLEPLTPHLSKIKKTFVDRRSPTGKQLMTSSSFKGLVFPGQPTNMMELCKDDFSEHFDVERNRLWGERTIVYPDEVSVKASWKHRSIEKGTSGRDASVFGGLGVLAIDEDLASIKIPKHSAGSVSVQFLQAYGAQLVRVEDTFNLPATVEDRDVEDLRTLYVTEYTWQAGYIGEYVMRQEGGGGLFVETHPFPHAFTPLEPDCGGALILGRKGDDGTLLFSAFEIPYGYSMVIDSNVIHGDSFFVGRYAISLTETEAADSVLIKRGDIGARQIQPVQQVPNRMRGANPRIFMLDTTETEVGMGAELRKQAVIAIGKSADRDESMAKKAQAVGFFKTLSKNDISKIRHTSETAQEAYDQQYGLVPFGK